MTRVLAIVALALAAAADAVAAPPGALPCLTHHVPHGRVCGVVATAHPTATEAARRALAAGGNAVDAAIAAGFALSVVEPYSSGLGGGGFAVVAGADPVTGRAVFTTALDFRERAPASAHRNVYIGPDGKPIPHASLRGLRAAGVPGYVAGLGEMHRRWGCLPWASLIEPAYEAAVQGFPASHLYVESAIHAYEHLAAEGGAAHVFAPTGLAPGMRIVQPELARTLARLARAGAGDFYGGDIAGRLVAGFAGHNWITAADLAGYRVRTFAPLSGPFEGHTIVSMPPPSSGGVHLLQMLYAVERTGGAASLGRPDDPARVHRLVEYMRRAYADRARYLGDPDFFPVPVAELLSEARIARYIANIDTQRATPSSAIEPPPAGGAHTSHVSVIDGQGNAVSMTQTINTLFGSGALIGDTGVLANNEMDDFAIAPGVPNAYGLTGGEANAIAPGKTPLSSMTPSIVLDGEGRVRAAVGAPGGSTIITTVLQTVLGLLADRLEPQAAVNAPRVHHQWLPDEINIEPREAETPLAAALVRMGHKLKVREPWGNAQAVQVHDGVWSGGSDRRGEGHAVVCR